MASAETDRKVRGAWFTPDWLVHAVVDAVIDLAVVDRRGGEPVRVLDPACGDGRFLAAAAAQVHSLGGTAELFGIDIDEGAVDAAKAVDTGGEPITILHDDALTSTWCAERAGGFDVVIGNPPYLSQMSSLTTRGGSSRHGGGPYADAAAEFLGLAAELANPSGGRLAFVLPQSILSARDAAAIRSRIDQRARMIWSTWTGDRDFDAQVVTCALAFEFGSSSDAESHGQWSHVVTQRMGVPALPSSLTAASDEHGTLGDRGTLNANFRDEYYGMIPAVGDHSSGPPLITSGLIDPGVSLWGRRPVRFAKQSFVAPRIDLEALDAKMTAWAHKRLVPKVLVANQTPVLEAVGDPGGTWLPGVPVVAVYPADPADVGPIEALLTSPAASIWAWHQRGGTGLSSNTIRVGPTMLAELAWPAGSLDDAVGALATGDVLRCGELVDEAYGLTADEHRDAMNWWGDVVERIASRQPDSVNSP